MDPDWTFLDCFGGITGATFAVVGFGGPTAGRGGNGEPDFLGTSEDNLLEG